MIRTYSVISPAIVLHEQLDGTANPRAGPARLLGSQICAPRSDPDHSPLCSGGLGCAPSWGCQNRGQCLPCPQRESPAIALQGADADLVAPGIRGVAEGEWTCLPTTGFARFQSAPCSLTSAGFLGALGSNTGEKARSDSASSWLALGHSPSSNQNCQVGQ